MPIMLEDLDIPAGASSKDADPKFFSSKLTGSGKKTGLLNGSLLPINTTTNTAYAAVADIERKQSSSQYDVTTTHVPLAPIVKRALLSGADFTLPVPHADDRFTAVKGWLSHDICFDMTPQGLVLYEDRSGQGMKRDLVVQYRMEVWFLRDGKPAPGRGRLVAAPTDLMVAKGDARVLVKWDTSPLENAEEFVRHALSVQGVAPSPSLGDDLQEWMREYQVYERIAGLARTWDSEAIADEVCQYIQGLPADPPAAQLDMLKVQLRYLENYNIPLEAYREIHEQLDRSFNGPNAAMLAKQNLSLLMNFTLDALNRMKPRLVTPGPPAIPPALPSHLSRQQLEALTTHEPLVMTQAGAGTGKSTVILQRIKYLEACGVTAGDITVLSFTNAAADNITEKNPDVGSMTIARMLIDIYALNHPTHKVSAIDTIINSLDIFYPNSQTAASFRHYLLNVEQNKTGAFTALNSFVEQNFDEVIEILDRIEQTSLELQIVICYQRIDAMAEPPHVQSKYLIIDEVQDNSIFEFIYLLKYVGKHEQSLFIVGDASQTLYEFRSANPRALNTLEGSGVFTTYKLTTNYRSNQEILDFANVALRGLTTNQCANIQLQANSLDVPTADSFREKVVLDHREVAKITSFVSEDLKPIVRNTVVPDFVEPCLGRGEQVAFLAYSRRDVASVQAVLQERYPGRHVASLVSERVYATDVFSKYIKFFWNDVLQTNPPNASFVVSQGIQDNLPKLTDRAGSPEVQKAILRTISEWWVENSAVIDGWVRLCALNALSDKEFFERLQRNLLDFEIRRNQQKLNVNKQRNQERKRKNLESKADLVVSTIHGAKGLEFDNVVVVYKDDTRMSQDARRMYYVAFTRAMRRMYVLSYATVKNAPIRSSYDSIVAALEARDAADALRAQGIDPDALVDEAVGLEPTSV